MERKSLSEGSPADVAFRGAGSGWGSAYELVQPAGPGSSIRGSARGQKKGMSSGFDGTNDGSGRLARHGDEWLERDRSDRLLGFSAADHVDQHPAIRRQRCCHRDGVPWAASPAAAVGHDPRRRRGGAVTHRVHRFRGGADAAAMAEDRGRARLVLYSSQAAGAGGGGRERDRGNRASLAGG